MRPLDGRRPLSPSSLGIPIERYKKYEQRSLLPHHLVARFCGLTSCDIRYLMTGHRTTQTAPGKPPRPRG